MVYRQPKNIMTSVYKTTTEIVNGDYCPLPVGIIPNQMGINLCSVAGVSWEKKDDGQLISLKIHFIPHYEEKVVNKHNEEDVASNDTTENEYLKKKEKFIEAARPLMKYLCENHHPHTSVIVNPTFAELSVGEMVTHKINDYLLD
jgi:hypothetical protein